mmetsp:Transcript_7784/g.29229  ORF Transcript_7784/g.29229 Transcript_7784/m.29229 type:complete len:299 (+) Transcript_7784:290-1186(+)
MNSGSFGHPCPSAGSAMIVRTGQAIIFRVSSTCSSVKYDGLEPRTRESWRKTHPLNGASVGPLRRGKLRPLLAQHLFLLHCRPPDELGRSVWRELLRPRELLHRSQALRHAGLERLVDSPAASFRSRDQLETALHARAKGRRGLGRIFRKGPQHVNADHSRDSLRYSSGDHGCRGGPHGVCEEPILLPTEAPGHLPSASLSCEAKGRPALCFVSCANPPPSRRRASPRWSTPHPRSDGCSGRAQASPSPRPASLAPRGPGPSRRSYWRCPAIRAWPALGGLRVRRPWPRSSRRRSGSR